MITWTARPDRKAQMRYRRDVPAGDHVAIDRELAHVRAHLSSVTDPDDDPDARADEVRVAVLAHVDGDPGMVSIIGEIDAEPDAPYLRADWVPEDTGSDLPLALERDPTDLTPEAYFAHMEAKGQR